MNQLPTDYKLEYQKFLKIQLDEKTKSRPLFFFFNLQIFNLKTF